MRWVFTYSAFLLLVFGNPYVLSSIACPVGWTQYDQYCYRLVTRPKETFTDAGTLCRGMGGELALPVTGDEVGFVWDMFRAENLTKAEVSLNGGLWMGCRRTGPDGMWDCSGTPTVQFGRWKSGEPDGSGDCVMMKYHGPVWEDVRCSTARFTACQRRLKSCTPHRRCMQVDSGHPNHCLLNHVLEEFPATSPMQCCIACTNEPRCRSFNLFGITCQLNFAQRLESTSSEDLVKNSTCVYYEIDK